MPCSDRKDWVFPELIEMSDIHKYADIFKKTEIDGNMTFDLEKTVSIHASFIGFLLMAKNETEKKGFSLLLNLSDDLKSLFSLLNIKDHFTENDGHITKSA